jgi:hypothetical protein
MANFEQQLVKANQISENIVTNVMFDFIRGIEKEFTRLNEIQLNEKSKDIYGDAIGFYSYATEVISKGKKKKGEPFDAKDTGSFLSKLYAKVENNQIVFGSTDSKVPLIINSDNWLSKDLFGLTDEDLNKVIEIRIKPFIINYYRKSLGL